jgi:2,3-bisphosphoglycerate-independent phosphoglycerate mutase
MVKTVRDGFPPGSDVANMTVLGLDPARYYTGRAPIEALSNGRGPGARRHSLRINLVTIAGDGPGRVMEDYCSDHISTRRPACSIEDLKAMAPDMPHVTMHPGIEYRHLMVARGYETPA